MTYFHTIKHYIKKNPKIAGIGVVMLLVILLSINFLIGSLKQVETEPSDSLPLVTVTSAAALTGEEEISVIGTVRAFSEAVITAEAAGRVTSVNATLGQTVPAGLVIATLENASERAAVLQAEGAYEAALAASEQSGVGVDEAETNLQNARNNALSTFSNAYTVVNGTIRNNVDNFFANPSSRLLGLKIAGRGQTQFLNNERIAYQTLLSEWLTETSALSTEADLSEALLTAINRVERTITLLDTFIALFNAEDQDNSYTESELLTFSTNFTNLRSTLQNTKNQLTNSMASLENAEAALERAEIEGSGTQSSAADAQVKQALGSLRAAQANLATTILRTPISGTVNSLSVRVGDFVGNQDVVARVANNNALEVITYVSDQEINAFAVGNSVVINNLNEGTVTEIAPVVDENTGKREVRVAIESDQIQNGDTVTISTTFTDESLDEQRLVFIPLSAVKFEIDNGFVFIVENGQLMKKPVELGVIRGNTVQVTGGLAIDEEFVLDARGLLPETAVEVRNQ